MPSATPFMTCHVMTAGDSGHDQIGDFVVKSHEIKTLYRVFLTLSRFFGHRMTTGAPFPVDPTQTNPNPNP